MKIFEVIVSANENAMLLPSKPYEEIMDLVDFDGRNKQAVWGKLEYYVSNPKKKRNNFFSLSSGTAFACDQIALDKLSPFLGYGWTEVLPISLEDGTELFIVNVVEVINALDQNKTEFDYYDDGTKGRILRFSFHEERLGESPIFKIPETSKTQILTYSGIKPPEEEFYSVYLNSGLKGLSFKELYSSNVTVG